MWVVVNPEKPIFNKFREFHKKRILIQNDGTQLRLYTDNLDDWYLKIFKKVLFKIGFAVGKHSSSKVL